MKMNNLWKGDNFGECTCIEDKNKKDIVLFRLDLSKKEEEERMLFWLETKGIYSLVTKFMSSVQNKLSC